MFYWHICDFIFDISSILHTLMISGSQKKIGTLLMILCHARIAKDNSIKNAVGNYSLNEKTKTIGNWVLRATNPKGEKEWNKYQKTVSY